VLACYRVVLLDGHAVGVVAAVLASDVGVASARGRSKFDDGSVLLAGHLDLDPLGFQFGDNGIDAALVDDLQTFGANGQSDGSFQTGHVELAFLNVRVEASLGTSV